MTGTQMTADECVGQNVVSTDSQKIGKIADVYLDKQTQQPEWFAVKTGFFGTKVAFVPLARAYLSEEGIVVPYTKDEVKDAPHAEPDGDLSEEEEAALYSHYGLSYSERRSSTGLPDGPAYTGTESRTGRDRTGTTDDDAMTRSEEELVAGKRSKETGRARLEKYVETEHRTVTVPIQRERARVVTEPITGENRDEALSGPNIRESAHEETLHEEEPVVEKRTVPKERVRLEKDTETDEREVGADLRKEKIRSEGDVDETQRNR